jgi:2,3-dihydroxybenzoate decarboxylase
MKTKRNKLNQRKKTKKNNSWDYLQKINCRFLNKKLKKVKKLKKIALEEAIIWPTQQDDSDEKNPPLEYLVEAGECKNKTNRLLDITDIRLKEMNENNISVQVISPSTPGIENVKSKNQISKAKEVNDYMFQRVKNNTDRFKIFATLPMSHPKESAEELERCVKKMNMVGALVNSNDFDSKGNALYYDTKEYDILWAKFVELDVPLYLHPRTYPTIECKNNNKGLLDTYKKYPQLRGSAWGFSVYIAEHMLRLILSGLFDRFPKLKIILGHMGEFLPWVAERFDHRLCIYKQNTEKKCSGETFYVPKKTVTEYLQQNIYITTSGWFSDDALDYVIKKMGIDRVLFSIDYPYENQNIASEWIDNVPLSFKDKEKIAYKNAEKLLHFRI